MFPAMVRPGLGLVVAVLCVCGTLSACASGPSTRDEACARFDALGESTFKANGIFDNVVSRNTGSLAGRPAPYPRADLSRDADRLTSISKSDRTNGSELMEATSGIADLCGHPLGTNAIFGS